MKKVLLEIILTKKETYFEAPFEVFLEKMLVLIVT
jgi:hypothetical protein